MHIFSDYARFWLCWVLIANFTWFGPSLWEKSMIWNQAKWREQQSKPNRPEAGRSKAHSVGQMKTKTHRSRNIGTGRDRAHHELPVGPTARGGWRTAVRCMGHGRAPGCATELFVFFVPFCFLAIFSAFNGHYVFKMGMYLALEEGRIILRLSKTLSKTPLKKKEEEEWGEAKATFLGSALKISKSFLFFSLFPSFSSILVRICLKCLV